MFRNDSSCVSSGLSRVLLLLLPFKKSHLDMRHGKTQQILFVAACDMCTDQNSTCNNNLVPDKAVPLISYTF